MHPVKTTFRRTTAVVAGTLLGLAGVTALAAPAGAHSPVVVKKAACLGRGGGWAVLWRIGSDFDTGATIGRLSATVHTNGAGEAKKVIGPASEAGALIPAKTAGDWKAGIAA